MGTEVLLTVDFVEVLDFKIIATSAHPNISTLAGMTLSEILDAIQGQTLTAGQFAALSNLLTIPSASNPVVLADDLATYYPLPVIGELKDSVPTFADLPLAGNTNGDLRPVIDENSIYRWTGSAWVFFIKAGTLEHTAMQNQDGSADFQHVGVLQKSLAILYAHTHGNFPILNQITSAGSGSILKANERARIPSTNEKEALVGSFGVPSSTSRYVTAVDPRLNTIRNPYGTIGPLGSGATYTGSSKSVFDLAYAALVVAVVKTAEVLPGTYDFASEGDFDPLIWSNSSGMTLEALSVGNSRIQVETFTSSLQFLPSATPALDGPVAIKGIAFELRSQGTEGVLIRRADTLIEDCVFTSAPGQTLGDLLKGLRIDAPRCVVRRCRFVGVLVTGLEITIEGSGCHIEDCEFSLSVPSSLALQIAASDVRVSANTFNTGTTEILNSALGTLFNENRYATPLALVPFTDAGSSTRWLSNSPPSQGQPYVGVVRSVGPSGSSADFTGATEIPFLKALEDPRIRVLEVFPGSYLFGSKVSLPMGYKIRSTTLDPSTVAIVGDTGVVCFELNSWSSLEGISVSSVQAHTIEFPVGAEGISIQRVELTQSTPGFFAVNIPQGCNNFTVQNCNFFGAQGIQVLGAAQNVRIKNSIFATAGLPLVTTSAISNSKLDSLIFQGNVPMDLWGSSWTVTDNHFLAAIPTKINTVNSVWSKNWPSPVSNNDAGIDTLKINATRALSPLLGSGAEKTSFVGISAIAFVESASGVAVSLPLEIPKESKINRNLGFTAELAWTASVFSGTVQWQLEIVFRDAFGLELGSPPASQIVLSARTKLVPRAEDLAVFSFPASSYGFIPGVNPTHVSIIVRRLAGELDPLDVLPGSAYLTALTLSLPRD